MVPRPPVHLPRQRERQRRHLPGLRDPQGGAVRQRQRHPDHPLAAVRAGDGRLRRSAFFGAQALRRSTQEIKVTVSDPPARGGGPAGRAVYLRAGLPATPGRHQRDRHPADANQRQRQQQGHHPAGAARRRQALVYPAKITQETAYSPGRPDRHPARRDPGLFQAHGHRSPSRPWSSAISTRPGAAWSACTAPPCRIQVSGEKLPADLARTLPAQRHRAERRGHRFHQERPAP